MRHQDTIVLLGSFRLPRDYAWRVGLVDAIGWHRREIGVKEPYVPPRFVGFFFNHELPVGDCRDARVNLERRPPIEHLPAQVLAATNQQYRITSEPGRIEPPFLLIHDRWDGACWLRDFASGVRFVTLTTPYWKDPPPGGNF